jgi:hypothetical protein
MSSVRASDEPPWTGRSANVAILGGSPEEAYAAGRIWRDGHRTCVRGRRVVSDSSGHPSPWRMDCLGAQKSLDCYLLAVTPIDYLDFLRQMLTSAVSTGVRPSVR